MNKLKKLSSFLLLLSSLNSLASAGEGKPYDSFVFFGDSLSDTGNLYAQIRLPKSPPYFQGRFSNGYVWVDLLVSETPNISALSYALGGETVLENSYLPWNLNYSTNLFLSEHPDRKNNSSLFFVWIGANDYLPDEFNDPENATDDEKRAFTQHVNDLTQAVIFNIEVQVQKLIDKGGMNFILVNLPDMSKTPYGLTSGKQHLLKSLTDEHNSKLAKMVTKLEKANPSLNIQLFDAYTPSVEFIENTKEANEKKHMNIQKTNVACWAGGYTFYPRNTQTEKALATKMEAQLNYSPLKVSHPEILANQSLAKLVTHSPDLNEAFRISLIAEEGLTPCNDPNEYVFWDNVHPSAVIHAEIAKEMSQFIKEKFKTL